MICPPPSDFLDPNREVLHIHPLPLFTETCSWYKNTAMPSCMGYTQACKKRYEMEEDQFEKFMSSKTTIVSVVTIKRHDATILPNIY